VAPLLFHRLKTGGLDRALRGVIDLLRESYQANLGWSLHLTQVLLAVSAELSGRGIFTVPYKGPALGALLHGVPEFRESVDLDILLHKQDAPDAIEALQAAGYTHAYDWTPDQVRANLRVNSEHAMISGDGVMVELQWAFLPRHFCFDLDVEDVFARRVSVDVGGRRMETLSAEDYFLVLSVHGAKHLWQRLSWIVDIAGLIAAARHVDWPGLMARAAHLRRRRMLLLGLHLAHTLLAAPLPEEVLASIAHDPAIPRLAADVCSSMSACEAPQVGLMAQSRFVLGAMDSNRDRARYLWRLGFTPTAGDAGGTLPPLFVRPFRIARKYFLPGAAKP
jgi:hypothetical protein